ncbi:MAG TPA: DUF6350 family protein [Mycobacteriales bacterium]|nr:DUF6350 family protein [Mycobacteriales bacterium]
MTGAIAAVSCALVSAALPLLVVLVTWVADPHSGASAGDATRTALQVWLLAHLGALTMGPGSIALAPLGLTCLVAVTLARAGRGLVRAGVVESGPDAVRAVAALAAPYAIVAGLVAAAAATPQVHPAAARALVGAFVIALGAGAWGIVRESGLGAVSYARLSDRADRVLRAGVGGVLGYLAAGGLALAGSLAAHAGTANRLATLTRPGLVGDLTLLALGLAVLPNAIIAGAAYLAGPGFALGAGTAVAPGAVHLGALPVVPILAAVPGRSAAPLVLGAVACLPVVVGALTGSLLTRGPRAGRSGVLSRMSPRTVAVDSGLAGIVAGTLAAALAALAGGPLGAGRMAALGPDWWQFGLVVGCEVATAGGLAVAVRLWLRDRRQPTRAGPRGRAARRQFLTTTVPTILSANVWRWLSHNGHR